MRKQGPHTEKEPKSKARKAWNIISGIIVGAVFVFLVLIIILVVWQRSGGKDVNLFGYYMFDVITESMEPTINAGEVILSKKADASALKEGDIITFTAPSGVLRGHNITHRITEVVRNENGSVKYFKTKGDNAGEDTWDLSPSAVKAVYVKKLPIIADLRNFLFTPAGYVVLIVLPLVLVGGLFIAGYVKDKAKAAKESADNKVVSLDDLSNEEKEKLLGSLPAFEEKENDVFPDFFDENGGEGADNYDSEIQADSERKDSDE